MGADGAMSVDVLIEMADAGIAARIDNGSSKAGAAFARRSGTSMAANL